MAVLALWQEKEERNPVSALLIPLLLFGYSKIWIVIIICAAIKMIKDAVNHRESSWDKTEHLAEKATVNTEKNAK